MSGRLFAVEPVTVKSLNIRVAFSAIDKLTRPVNAARQSAGGLSESLKKTQSVIKGLESQSRTFNRLRDSVRKTSRNIDDARRTLDGLSQAHALPTNSASIWRNWPPDSSASTPHAHRKG